MKTKITRILSFIVCLIAIAALAINTGCNGKIDKSETSSASETSSVSSAFETLKSFTFTVTTADGKEKSFNIESDKKTVGEALLSQNLIAGDKGEFGLYVKAVDGETLDYETDGKYWAFYVNGEYASAGVEATPIENGATYSFKAEK